MVKLKEIYEFELGNIIYGDNFFCVAYCPKINGYLLCVCIPGGVGGSIGHRFYKISKEEYNLYSNDKESFCKKFKKELSHRDISSERFIGGSHDYDIGWHFGVDGRYEVIRTRCDKTEQYQYVFWQEMFWLRFNWNGEIILVPPDKCISIDGKTHHPFRKLSGVRFYEFNGKNQFAKFWCYGIPEKEILNGENNCG